MLLSSPYTTGNLLFTLNQLPYSFKGKFVAMYILWNKIMNASVAQTHTQICTHIHICVCVCVRERETDRQTDRQRDREKERKKGRENRGTATERKRERQRLFKFEMMVTSANVFRTSVLMRLPAIYFPTDKRLFSMQYVTKSQLFSLGLTKAKLPSLGKTDEFMPFPTQSASYKIGTRLSDSISFDDDFS